MKTPEIKISINVFKLIELIQRLRRKKIRTVRGHKFALRKDKRDKRDFVYKLRRYGVAPESTERKNINSFSVRYDQGNIGSCGLNSFLYIFRYMLKTNGQSDFNGSRLYGYYNARNNKSEDTGVTLRDVYKSTNKFGICSEELWPYKVNKFAIEPPEIAYKDGEKHQSIRYERIYPVTKEAIKDAISNGIPIHFGMRIYSSFMTDEVARTGIVPIPSRCFEECLGGHAMAGFDYDSEYVITLNSWGSSWGQNGVCQIPWEVILNPRLVSDVWVLYETE